MADDVLLNAGSGGDTLGADDISSVKYQRNKLIFGPDGVNDGDVAKTNPFPVDPHSLSSPQRTHASSSSVSAGSSDDLDSAQVTSSTTGKLVAIIMGASVPLKGELKTVLNGVASSTLITFFTPALETRIFEIPKNFITQAEDATAGLDGFRVTVTNLDTSQAADVYVTFLWDEE